MTQTLPNVTHEHHERLLAHVDRMPEFADRYLAAPPDEIRASVARTATFLGEVVLPHMDAAERTLYPELERLLQNRHSMSPMKREHATVRALVAEFVRLERAVHPDAVPIGQRLALRRVAFQMYALLKIHLTEEEAYLHVVERGVTPEVAGMLAAAMDHPGFRED